MHYPTPQGKGRVAALPNSSPLAPAPSVCVPSSWSLASSQGSSPPTTSRWPGVWGVARMRRGRREASMIARVHVFKLHLRTHSRHHQAHPPPSMLVLFLRSRRRPFPPVAAAAFSSVRGDGLLGPRRADQCGRDQVGVEDDESADLDDKTQNYSFEARRYVQESLITLKLFWSVISCEVPSLRRVVALPYSSTLALAPSGNSITPPPR